MHRRFIQLTHQNKTSHFNLFAIGILVCMDFKEAGPMHCISLTQKMLERLVWCYWGARVRKIGHAEMLPPLCCTGSQE